MFWADSMLLRSSGVSLGPVDTGWVTAGSGSSTGSGNVAWSNPGNITADDASSATATLAQGSPDSTYLLANNFGFDLTGWTEILGIEVRVERMRSGGQNVADGDVHLFQSGSAVGTDKATGTNFPTSFGVVTYGGSSDLWGITPSVADVEDSAFGVGFRATYTGTFINNGTATVDVIQMRVHGTGPV